MRQFSHHFVFKYVQSAKVKKQSQSDEESVGIRGARRSVSGGKPAYIKKKSNVLFCPVHVFRNFRIVGLVRCIDLPVGSGERHRCRVRPRKFPTIIYGREKKG